MTPTTWRGMKSTLTVRPAEDIAGSAELSLPVAVAEDDGFRGAGGGGDDVDLLWSIEAGDGGGTVGPDAELLHGAGVIF